MSSLPERLNQKKEKDIKILRDFVAIYCRETHREADKAQFKGEDIGLPAGCVASAELCDECNKLLKHGVVKLLLCQYDPKPMCKKCQTHCYAPGYREKVREVMRFSGMYLIKHGRVDLLVHYAL